MRRNSIVLCALSVVLGIAFCQVASAGDIEWSGVYRIEGYDLHNSELRGSHKSELDYGLHHLVLRPKIVASDGLTIYGQFDLFNNTASAYSNSQMGDVFGDGVRDSTTTAASATTSGQNSNTFSQTESAGTLQISQLYLTWTQEYGSLIVGRAPLQFGLGMTYSAGRGLFDHWYDTRDMVGYKIVMGNLYFLPMLGKDSEGALNKSDDINDYMIQVEYQNPDSDLEMGVFYQLRQGGDAAHDAPAGTTASNGNVLGGPNGILGGGISLKTVNVYALKDDGKFRAGMEASFQSGDTGVVTGVGGDKVTWEAFGLAGEFGLRPAGSKWSWSLKTGYATGDDPKTDAKFESYIFNRNYDVAMLMFNHPLGQDDFFGTRLIKGNVYDTGTHDINTADTESISNVMYVAPKAHYQFADKWSLDNTLATGWLATNPLSGHNVAKDLGYEWDIAVNYQPRKGVEWVNEIGTIFPGGAWKGGGQYDSSFGYGFATKAAISF